MKRVVLLAVFFAVAVLLEAQNPPFPDGGFENCWRDCTPWGKPVYQDLKTDYFLTTLNELYELSDEQGVAPLTAFRLEGEGVYDGKYSLKLASYNMTIGTRKLFLPGAAGTLEIIIDIDAPNGGDCIMGKPFTARPTALTGYRKYAPVNGDSAAVEVQLKKGGSVIGEGKQVITASIANWTKFNIPIAYTSEETPDTIIVVFAASANYDFTDIETLMNCKGQEGSTLCLDNIEFEYEVGIKEMFAPAIKLSVYPNPSKERVNIQIAKESNGTAIIYDYLTRKTAEYPISGTQIDVDISTYATGSYLINIVENGKVVTTGRFVKE